MHISLLQLLYILSLIQSFLFITPYNRSMQNTLPYHFDKISLSVPLIIEQDSQLSFLTNAELHMHP